MQAKHREGRLSAREHDERFIAGRWFPVIAGIITASAVTWMWGGLDMPGALHDERAYLVQARLLAAGSWTAITPPLQIFWEMPHVFLEPAVFAKYPPGFAPLLVPGVWLGLPGLGPAVLAGVAAALLVLLVRRIAGAWVAAAAWLLWTSAPKMANWHGTYLSEVATVPLYLGALLALHQWLERPRRAPLIALVACVGWLGVSRPVTGIALALPIAVVLLVRAWRMRALPGWRPAALLGIAICSLVPYWSWRTIGSATRMPYSEYSREYFPWDMPGFVRDTSAPRRMLPPDYVLLARATGVNYIDHRAARIPEYLVRRSARMASDATGHWASPAWILAPIGLMLVGGSTAIFVFSSALLLFAAYTLMPHTPEWTIYYLELFPLVAAAAAYAFARATRTGIRSIALLANVAFVALVVGNVTHWPEQRRYKSIPSARQRMAQVLLRELPDPRAVVFVRRDERLSPHFTLWDMLGPPDKTPTWVVRDLGLVANQQLLTHAEGRAAYILDERAMTLSAWNPPAVGAPQPGVR